MTDIGPEPGRLFNIFQELVRIDSEPGREGKLRDYVIDFCAGIGLVTCEDLAGEVTGGESGNLVIRVPPGAPSSESPIILNAHMDTVTPGKGVVPVEEDDRFTSTGDTILGADDKAGVAAILAAVECIMGAGLENRALEVLLTVQEEPGLIGAKNLDHSLLEGRWGLVLDGSGGVGGIVLEAPSRDRVTFTVRGRAAHAGVEPEKGISAIACAAEAIAGLSLGRLDERTTANIGIINGGRACNIVPDLVVVQGELRSLSEERLEEERRAMVDRFRQVADRTGCRVEVQVKRSFSRFSIDTSSAPVAELCRAMEECGLEPWFARTGGGSDANVLNQGDLEMITLNVGLANAHSSEEFILKEDLLNVSRILVCLALMGAPEEGDCR